MNCEKDKILAKLASSAENLRNECERLQGYENLDVYQIEKVIEKNVADLSALVVELKEAVC